MTRGRVPGPFMGRVSVSENSSRLAPPAHVSQKESERRATQGRKKVEIMRERRGIGNRTLRARRSSDGGYF